MWCDLKNKHSECRLSDSDLALEMIRDHDNKIFILDAPTESGKTYFVEHFAGGEKLSIPANVLKETVLYSCDNYHLNTEILLYFLTSLNLNFFIIEDIDIAFKHIETQKLLAQIVIWLQRKAKVILTGIDIDHSNKVFLDCMQNVPTRYFKYSR